MTWHGRIISGRNAQAVEIKTKMKTRRVLEKMEIVLET
jgi:hypothetical protein